MTPTDRPQKPRECEHYGKRNFFEWLMDGFPHCKCPNKESGICIWKRNFRINCPKFTPKTKEKDDSRTSDTSNN